MNLDKARKLAKYTESLATRPDWGVDDQDTLEWLITMVDRLQEDGLYKCGFEAGKFTAEQQVKILRYELLKAITFFDMSGCDRQLYGSISQALKDTEVK